MKGPLLKSTRSVWLTGDPANQSWYCTLPMAFCKAAGLELGDVLECAWQEGSDEIRFKIRKASD